VSAPAIGILIAVMVDVVVPIGLAALLIVRGRHGNGPGVTRWFYIGAGIYLLLVALVIPVGIRDVFAYGAGGVIGATITALPTSLVPALVNSFAMHYFFSEKEWAHGGYQTVLTIYVSGMLGWALLNAALLRALITASRRSYAILERAARARDDAAGPGDLSILTGESSS
jgi:hypothetical protein